MLCSLMGPPSEVPIRSCHSFMDFSWPTGWSPIRSLTHSVLQQKLTPSLLERGYWGWRLKHWVGAACEGDLCQLSIHSLIKCLWKHLPIADFGLHFLTCSLTTTMVLFLFCFLIPWTSLVLTIGPSLWNIYVFFIFIQIATWSFLLFIAPGFNFISSPQEPLLMTKAKMYSFKSLPSITSCFLSIIAQIPQRIHFVCIDCKL